STSSTTTVALEICGNCTDDDHDGLTDLEDPACCSNAGTMQIEQRVSSLPEPDRSRSVSASSHREWATADQRVRPRRRCFVAASGGCSDDAYVATQSLTRSLADSALTWPPPPVCPSHLRARRPPGTRTLWSGTG